MDSSTRSVRRCCPCCLRAYQVVRAKRCARRGITQSVLKEFPCTIYLFGSFARGEERASSDIDIGIEGLSTIPSSVFSLLRERLEESAIPYRVDVVDLNAAQRDFRDQVRNEGVVWNG